MFTLKLWRWKSHPSLKEHSPQKMHMCIPVERVVVLEIGETGHALELQAYYGPGPIDFRTYYVGDPEPGMEAYGSDSRHLEVGVNSWWGWGLLENWEGNTSEHYRPASYG